MTLWPLLAQLACGIWIATCTPTGISITSPLPSPVTALSSFTVDPAPIPSGGNATGEITLADPAPAGGAGVSVTLSASNLGVVSIPSSVTVAAGQQVASFTVLAATVTDPQDVQLAASYGGMTLTVPVTVAVPIPPQPSPDPTAPLITALTPATVTVGTSSQRVTIYGTNFTPNALVFYAGSEKSVTFVNSTELSIQLWSTDMNHSGAYPVVVQNWVGGLGYSSPGFGFQVVTVDVPAAKRAPNIKREKLPVPKKP